MPAAEIITIGTELLLGDVQDTNSRFIAQRLKENGYDLFRISTVGDNQDRIATLLKESIQRSDFVITTGGLGPTVDDPTREAVAQAFGINLEFHEELWAQISSRFQKRGLSVSENNRKQAYIPEKAIVIENKYGTAPGFIFPWRDRFIICLQGVPHEMERLLTETVLPFLQKTMPPSHFLFSKVLHTIGIGESVLDEMVESYEKMTNPTVGLLAHAGMVDIRIVGAASTMEVASTMVQKIETEIREIAAEYIYGENDEKIEDVIAFLAGRKQNNPAIYLIDFPTDFSLEVPNIFINLLRSNSYSIPKNLEKWLAFQSETTKEKSKNQISIFSKSQSKITRTHMGPPQSFNNWAKNLILYYLWLELKDK